ncbi:hypothetical protein MMC28_010887 [Mycoblastus sanguinarius]|nr:hypothetical protein [Mycoblastus sanguinarius]
MSRTADPNKICISGKICDTIYLTSSIAPVTTIDGIDPKITKQRRSRDRDQEMRIYSLVRLSHWISESSSITANCVRYPDDGSRETAYWRTLVGNAGQLIGDSHDDREEIRISDDYALHFWHFRQFLTKLCPGGVVNGAPLHQLLNYILAPHAHGFANFEEVYFHVAPCRRFFTTIGGYMGLGHPRMQPGDKVCVFMGGAVPWVIRQEGEEYVLIGECYVHGLMDGEAMRTERLPVQDLVIK